MLIVLVAVVAAVDPGSARVSGPGDTNIESSPAIAAQQGRDEVRIERRSENQHAKAYYAYPHTFHHVDNRYLDLGNRSLLSGQAWQST
jgi:hypothetical protein